MNDINTYLKEIAACNDRIDRFTAEGKMDVVHLACKDLSEYLKHLDSTLPDSFEASKVLGIGYFDLGSSYRNISMKELAETAYTQAMEYLQAIIKSDEHKEFAINQIAACKNHLGLLYMDHGPVNLAIKYLDQAIWDRTYIADHYPENMYNKVYLAGATCNRGHVERNAGRPKSAIIRYKDAIAQLEEIIPSTDGGITNEVASAISNAQGSPHWVTMAQSFLDNARAGLEAAQK